MAAKVSPTTVDLKEDPTSLHMGYTSFNVYCFSLDISKFHPSLFSTVLLMWFA